MASSSSSSQTSTLGPEVDEKLTREDWILWKAQFLPAIRGAQLMHYLNEKTIAPPEQITVMIEEKKEVKVPNPEYTTWVAQDQQVLSYLLNSITKEILGHVTTKVTTATTWSALEELFASQ
jgi:hypothetical protein